MKSSVTRGTKQGRSTRKTVRVETECICRLTKEHATVPHVPSEYAIEMPETIKEYIDNSTLKKYFFDTYITNFWVKKVKNSLPYVCKCCKTLHSELYKKVIVHVLKGGEIPSEIVKEEGGNGKKNNNNPKVLSCLFCVCTTVTCPVQKRSLDIDKIRENSRIVSRALTAPTSCDAFSDAAIVDVSNKKGRVPFKKNTGFDTFENLGIDKDDYRLKYLLDDSTLSVSEGKCDVSITSSISEDKQDKTFKACYGPKDGAEKCYRGRGVMYLIGARDLRKQKNFKTKQKSVDEEDYAMDDDDIPVKYRSRLTDDPLFGQDPSLCQKCYKRVEFNNFEFIFRRTVKKFRVKDEKLICTCDLDPYDVLEAEVLEESECEKEVKNVRKQEFNILMKNVTVNWNQYVNSKRDGIHEPMNNSTVLALEDLARFFYKDRLDESLISASISYSGVSTVSKPSSTDSDIICKIGVIANKLYKKFPPCAAMLEELQEKFEGEEEGDPMTRIQTYAKELKIRMMPQKISMKKQQSGKKKEVYCDNHEKEEMVGLIKYEAEKLIKPNGPEEEAGPEEESIQSKAPRCPETIVDTSSDEENVDRLRDLVSALQRRNPREDEEETEPPKACTCGLPPLIKVTSEDNCKKWIQENWNDSNLIDKLAENEEILVEFSIEPVEEEESDLADNYNKMVCTIKSQQEEKAEELTGAKRGTKIEKEKEREREKERDKERERDKGKGKGKGKGNEKEDDKKKREKEKKVKKEKERPSIRRKKSRIVRKTVAPGEMEDHSLNYRQMVEYLHSRKNVPFKEITRLYKYPILRLPAPQWSLRSKLLMKLRNKKIMLDDGKGHRMQIFVLPSETWQGKVLSKPLISYGMLRRKIMPFRQKYPKWIRPVNIQKFKKSNVINEEVLKNMVLPEAKRKLDDKKVSIKEKNVKKKFCRSIRSKYKSTEKILSLLAHNYDVQYYFKEIKDESNPCIDNIDLPKNKAKTAKDVRVEQNFKKEVNDKSIQNFIRRQSLTKKKAKMTKNDKDSENNEKAVLDENNLRFVKKVFSAVMRAKIAKKEWDNKNSYDISNQWVVEERRIGKKKKKNKAQDEWEKHKNCEKYVVNLIKVPPDVVVKRKYLYRKIMVDPHRKLIIVELKRGEKHHSQSMIRYFIPFIIVPKISLPTKTKSSADHNNVVYYIRNALLKQIKNRFRLPPLRLLMKKLVQLAEALFKLTMGYEAKRSVLEKFQETRFELFGYRSLRGKSLEEIALSGFNIVMYWLLFKLKLYAMYSLLRSERFDAIMAPMVAKPKPIPENSSEWLEELNGLRFQIQCQTLMEIEEYGRESKGIKAKNSKMPSLAKVLDKCRQCANPLSKELAETRALNLFNALVALVKQLYDYEPPSRASIMAFKLPELKGSDEELFKAAEQGAYEAGSKEPEAPPVAPTKPEKEQKQAPVVKPVQQKPVQQPDKKGGPTGKPEVPSKGEAERAKELIAFIKFKKWMNYEFEANIYRNQRYLTLEGLIEYIREAAEDTIIRKKSLELEHIIPGLLGITVEGLIEADKDRSKAKGNKTKKGGKNFSRARCRSISRKSRSCVRTENPFRTTFQQLLVKKIYGIPDLIKSHKSIKSRKSTLKVRGKKSFWKPKLIIVPTRKPKLIVVRETNSEPAVIAKGELNIALNIDKTEFRNLCTPILTKLNTTTLNNLLTKISSQNLVKNKLMHFISLAKHKKKLKPSYSDPVLYKKCNPILLKEARVTSAGELKLKKTCSMDQSVSFQQNKTVSNLINLITEHLEELLTIEVLKKQTRKLQSESALIKPRLPMIKKTSVQKLIQKKRKRKNMKKILSKTMKTLNDRAKTSKSKGRVKGPGSSQGSSKKTGNLNDRIKTSKSKAQAKGQGSSQGSSKTTRTQNNQVKTSKSKAQAKSQGSSKGSSKTTRTVIVRAKTSKSKAQTKGQGSSQGSSKGKKQVEANKNVTLKTGKGRGHPNTPESVLRKGGKNKGSTTNKKENIPRNSGKNQNLKNTPAGMPTKFNKSTPNRTVLNTQKTGKKKCESIVKNYRAEKVMGRKDHHGLITYPTELSSSEPEKATAARNTGNYQYVTRIYCKSARRIKCVTTLQTSITKHNDRMIENQGKDPVRKVSASAFLTQIRNRLAEIPQHQYQTRNPSSTEENLEDSSDELQIRDDDHTDTKKSTNSHHKSYKKKSDSATDKALRKEHRSSSTLYSTEAITSPSPSRTSHQKHKHKITDKQ